MSFGEFAKEADKDTRNEDLLRELWSVTVKYAEYQKEERRKKYCPECQRQSGKHTYECSVRETLIKVRDYIEELDEA